jgi:hypothetical protein
MVGVRIDLVLLGGQSKLRFGVGLRFALGLGTGMLLFAQAVVLTALAGWNASPYLAYAALGWGAVEIALLARTAVDRFERPKLGLAHLWWLLLVPAGYAAWIFARLSTLEGTLEFDAHAFWVFKAKLLHLVQGHALTEVLHQASLAYAHLDYPLLVPGLYTLTYGAVGGVDEFVCKVWPFWMVMALAAAVLSLGQVWRRPRPLPFFTVLILAFLPATLHYVRNEGGTIPMVFFVSLAALLFEAAITERDDVALAALLPVLAGAAMTKLEGLLYACLCGFVLLAIAGWRGGFRRPWPRKPHLWKTLVVSVLALMPYVGLRLVRPVPHPESGWLAAGLAAPAAAWHRLPETWFLNVVGRFFNQDFFRWQSPDGERLQWVGQWLGSNSFANQQLSILPWILSPLLALALWRGRFRVALAWLLAIDLAVFSILSLVIACLPRMQKNLQTVIEFSTTGQVGRYFCPFFIALFLATIATWFTEASPGASTAPAPPEANPERRPSEPRHPARRPRQRRNNPHVERRC